MNYELSRALAANKQYLESLGFVRAALAVRPDSSGALCVLAELLDLAGESDAAIRAFERVVELNPKNYPARNRLGIELMNLNRFDEAISQFRRAIEINSGVISARYNLGKALRAKGQFEEAIAVVQASIEVFREDASLHDLLANALGDLGQIDDAIEEHRRAIELNPRNPTYHSNLGTTLHNRKQDYEDAAASFRRAVALDPKVALYHFNLGNALKALGQFDAALAEYRLTIELDPEYPHAHANLGDALLNLGQLDEAIRAWQRAIELDPKNEYARTQLARAQPQIAAREKLPSYLAGDYQPATNKERLRLVNWCRIQKRYHAGARLYAEVFSSEPRLFADHKVHRRYNAACTAALAADGQGIDAANLDDAERSRLRRQAFDWLRADLTQWTEELKPGEPAVLAEIRQTMLHWQQDADLASLRERAALEKLPAEERAALEQLWADVAGLLERAR